jgi:hypothetical protein
LGALYPDSAAAAARTLLAGHGAHMCSLELTWRLQRIKGMGSSSRSPLARDSALLSSPERRQRSLATRLGASRLSSSTSKNTGLPSSSAPLALGHNRALLAPSSSGSSGSSSGGRRIVHEVGEARALLL